MVDSFVFVGGEPLLNLSVSDIDVSKHILIFKLLNLIPSLVLFVINIFF